MAETTDVDSEDEKNWFLFVYHIATPSSEVASWLPHTWQSQLIFPQSSSMISHVPIWLLRCCSRWLNITCHHQQD